MYHHHYTRHNRQVQRLNMESYHPQRHHNWEVGALIHEIDQLIVSHCGLTLLFYSFVVWRRWYFGSPHHPPPLPPHPALALSYPVYFYSITCLHSFTSNSTFCSFSFQLLYFYPLTPHLPSLNILKTLWFPSPLPSLFCIPYSSHVYFFHFLPCSSVLSHPSLSSSLLSSPLLSSVSSPSSPPTGELRGRGVIITPSWSLSMADPILLYYCFRRSEGCTVVAPCVCILSLQQLCVIKLHSALLALGGLNSLQ